MGPGATGTRVIRTPWPLVAGLGLVSLAFAIYYRRTVINDAIDRHRRAGDSFSPKKWKRLCPLLKDWGSWTLKLVFSSGAVVCQIIDLKGGAKTPSIGVMTFFLNLVVHSMPLESAGARCYLGYTVAIAGFMLFALNGALRIRHTGFKDRSYEVSVAMGCPNGTSTEFSGTKLCAAAPQPYTFPYSDTADTYRVVFWILGLLYAAIALGHMSFWLSKRRILTKLTIANLAVALVIAGALLAVFGDGFHSGAVAVSYDDCRGAQQRIDGNWIGCVSSEITFAGSRSGFWTIWARDKEAVARSIFVW
jgi:hypothetical protein